MDHGICPFCGLRRNLGANDFCRGADRIVVLRRSEQHREPPSRSATAGELLDRFMNWAVGVLLVAATAVLVVVQTHPPL